MTAKESDKYCNTGDDYHSVCGNKPYCPECHAMGKEYILEQGFDHNHRHHCYRCGVTYWIKRE